MRIEKKFAKLKRCDHSPKREEFIDVSLDPLYFSLDSPFNLMNTNTMLRSLNTGNAHTFA
jgi:hypothetical protein